MGGPVKLMVDGKPCSLLRRLPERALAKPQETLSKAAKLNEKK